MSFLSLLNAFITYKYIQYSALGHYSEAQKQGNAFNWHSTINTKIIMPLSRKRERKTHPKQPVTLEQIVGCNTTFVTRKNNLPLGPVHGYEPSPPAQAKCHLSFKWPSSEPVYARMYWVEVEKLF